MRSRQKLRSVCYIDLGPDNGGLVLNVSESGLAFSCAMKLIGEGKFKGDQITRSLGLALSKPYITGLNIGFSRPEQMDDIFHQMVWSGVRCMRRPAAATAAKTTWP